MICLPRSARLACVHALIHHPPTERLPTMAIFLCFDEEGIAADQTGDGCNDDGDSNSYSGHAVLGPARNTVLQEGTVDKSVREGQQ